MLEVLVPTRIRFPVLEQAGGDLIWPSPHKAAGFYDDWAEIGNAEEQWGPTIQEWEEMRKTWNRGLGEELFPQHLFEIEDVLDEYSMSYSYLW